MSTYDPTDLRAQEQTRDDAKRRDRVAQTAENEDIKWLMSSKRGRRIVWRLLDRAGVFRLSFNTNAMQMAFAEGNRNFGNRILSLIHAHVPELYPTMVKENTDVRSNADDGNGHTNQ
jgi:hypothetical protein